jgi:thiol:disulfide interchange protein
MRSRLTIVAWLRGLKRGFKFAILLVAAWAPFLFPEHPVVTGLLMGLCTAVFFIATGPSGPTSAASAGSIHSGNLEDSRVEP